MGCLENLVFALLQLYRTLPLPFSMCPGIVAVLWKRFTESFCEINVVSFLQLYFS